MSKYNPDELFQIIQVLAGILITVGYAFTLAKYHGSVPPFAFIGTAIGLAIIIGCWIGTRHLAFMLTIVFMSIVFSIYFHMV